jgi:hypothetical protein
MQRKLWQFSPLAFLTCGLAVLALLGAPRALATTLVQMDLDQLTRTAAVVARARCLTISARWEGGHLWTLTTFEVVEVWKSQAPQTIVVRLVGGSDGHRTVRVDGVPRFRPGEEAVLFLEPSGMGELTVTSWAQGTFRIHRDPTTRKEVVTQDSGGLGVFDPATQQFHAGGVRRMAIEPFRERVLRATRSATSGSPRERRR